MPVKIEYTCDVCGAPAETANHGLKGFEITTERELDRDRFSAFSITLCAAHYASFQEACKAWLKEAVG